jgi:hypothetical protein
MRIGVTIGGLVAAAALGSGAYAQSDRDVYLEQIQRSGMSEVAAAELLSAAAPLAGVSRVRLARNRQGIFWDYEAVACIPAGTTESGRAKAKALVEERRAKLDSWITFLKVHADTDMSGFVSTDEATILRRRVELGFAVSATGSHANLEELSHFLGETPAEVQKDVDAYRSIRSAAVSDGRTSMPDLP